MNKHIFIHVLMVLAFVTAAISPACAFVKGESQLIEICAADGSVQTISASGEPIQTHKAVKKDCGFCFAQTHMKASAAVEITIIVPSTTEYYKAGAGTIVPRTLALNAYQSQAPPASFS